MFRSSVLKAKTPASKRRLTSFLSVQNIEGKQHGIREGGGFLLAGEVEAIDLPCVAPLVEGGRGLVVLQAFDDGVVNDHLEKGSKTV